MKINLKDISLESIGRLVASDFHRLPWYHFSIDDVFDSLIEVTVKNIPLFKHPFFSLMKEIHDEYGTQVDLELFWERKIDGTLYTLADVRDLKEELSKDGNWIKFGPHAESYMRAPFEQAVDDQKKVFDYIYKEIDRFAGTSSYAKWVRLHYYSESYELAEYFKNKGVDALFTTDREAGSHRMPEAIANCLLNEGCASYEDMNFIRTQYRVEVFTNSRKSENDLKKLFLDSLEKYGYIIFYSHEYEFARSEVREMTRKAFKVLSELNISSIKH